MYYDVVEYLIPKSLQLDYTSLPLLRGGPHQPNCYPLYSWEARANLAWPSTRLHLSPSLGLGASLPCKYSSTIVIIAVRIWGRAKNLVSLVPST